MSFIRLCKYFLSYISIVIRDYFESLYFLFTSLELFSQLYFNCNTWLFWKSVLFVTILTHINQCCIWFAVQCKKITLRVKHFYYGCYALSILLYALNYIKDLTSQIIVMTIMISWEYWNFLFKWQGTFQVESTSNHAWMWGFGDFSFIVKVQKEQYHSIFYYSISKYISLHVSIITLSYQIKK